MLLTLAGCVGPSSSPVTPPKATTPSESEEVVSLKSQLRESQEELASYRLREQNWEYWESIRTLQEKTLAGVSKVRELAAPEQVGLRVVMAEWAQENWGKNYVRDNRKKTEIDERIFKSLFILPGTTSLANLYIEWPRSYLLATEGDKIYFVQENLVKIGAEDARKALAHEAVHILQGEFQPLERATYDEDKAWSALIEGDADFSASKYIEKASQTELLPTIDKPPGISSSQIPETPRPQALDRLLYFPYQYGKAFASLLYQKGGWQKLNEAYQTPPSTTEQVMHPEKYLINEGPKNIKAPTLNIPGWEERRSDRFGEYFIKVTLETKLTEPEASRAAQGWGGDRLTYYEGQEDFLFVWQTVWDSNEDAVEFSEAFLEMLQRSDAGKLGQGSWLAQGKHFRVELSGRFVLIVVSPSRQMIDLVLAAGLKAGE